MNLLKENQIVDGYRVQNRIKGDTYKETYRVVDADERPFFLKLFAKKNMPPKLLDEQGEVMEIKMCGRLTHPNIISYVGSGMVETEAGECPYYVTNYFNGELLAERIRLTKCVPFNDALAILQGILEGLKYMHSQVPPVIHNDITPHNIMLVRTAEDMPVIIDMGHASHRVNGNPAFDTADLDVLYRANETFFGMYDEQSDIYAAMAVFYTMLVGHAPWHVDFAENASRADMIDAAKKARKGELDFGNVALEEYLKDVLRKGLALKYAERYKKVDEILIDLRRKDVSTDSDNGALSSLQQMNDASEPRSKRDEEPKADFKVEKGKGNGFKDIAGMKDLKALLQQKVIFVLKDQERAKKYRLTPPNGMLLYGPPGCGKTFFAEKFAEETGFNFMLIKASDLASVYIHGTQEKIAELFKKAEAQAPAIICFDEFDALVPNRSGADNQHYSSEVNEFLSQLNNCSHRGIFVIATTNRPDKIDPAVVRTGRIDKLVYVPLPDFEARREMFLLHLEGRPYEGVDADELAKMSDGYVSSDIAFVVNDAAMTAAFLDKPITQESLVTSLRNIRPSIRKELLLQYEQMREQMEGVECSNRRNYIGFIQY